MDRFKSVLVEGKGEALRTMAAYIDLNPVRAGLVKDPKDYRWCGYAEALGGSRRAQRGLCKAIGKPVDGWQTAGAAEAYRCILFDEGREVKDAQNENVMERGVSVESARAVLAERGKLSPAELVRLRVRYFSDGAVLGSKAFVEGIFEAQREQFSPKRKQGARRITESVEPFYALRRLRIKPLGSKDFGLLNSAPSGAIRLFWKAPGRIFAESGRAVRVRLQLADKLNSEAPSPPPRHAVAFSPPPIPRKTG